MSEQVWASILAAIPDVQAWNRNLGELKRLAAEYGPECKKYFAEEAERRGYLWSSESKCYTHPWRMIACKFPGRLLGVGWRSGQLACIFTGEDGPVRYESVSKEIPAETAQKLVNSLYPDALYKKSIIDRQVPMTRVG